MKKLKSLLNIGLVAGLALCAIAPVSTRADSFTVTSKTKPAPSTTIVLLNTSGDQLVVQGSNDDKHWEDVLYNDFPGTGTFDVAPAGYSFAYYRMLIIPAPAPRRAAKSELRKAK